MSDDKCLFKISIIVPIYNAETFIYKCVDSLLVQTYSNIEIILVDDGSPDRCPQICDAYAQADSRIKVIHKKNGGVASARNAGLDAAQGNYVMFVDSDDWILPDYCEVMLQTALEKGTEVVCSNFEEVFEEGVVLKPVDGQIAVNQELDTLDQVLKDITDSELYTWPVWAKLYASSVVKGLYFDQNMKFAEDVQFARDALVRAKKISLIVNNGYCYYRNASSVTILQKKSMRWAFDDIKVMARLVEICEKNESQYVDGAKILFYQYVITGFEILGETDKFCTSFKEDFNVLRQYAKQAVENKTKIGMNYKMKMFMYCYCFGVGKVVVDFYRGLKKYIHGN